MFFNLIHNCEYSGKDIPGKILFVREMKSQILSKKLSKIKKVVIIIIRSNTDVRNYEDSSKNLCSDKRYSRSGQFS